jgi:predicted MFS family arabinose efflux permease
MMIIVPQLTSMMYVYPVVFVTMALVGARVGPLNAWMTALVDARRRGSLMSLTMATGQAGFAVGAAVAGPAYVRYGYTSNAWLGVAGAIAAALLLLGVPEPARET